MTGFKSWELAAAAAKLIKEVALVKPGERVVITSNTGGCEEVVEATAQAARAHGAIPVVVWHAMNPQPHMEPPDPMAAAIKASDVWIEYALGSSLYTRAYEEALVAGSRYVNMTAAQVDWFIRTIGQVDYPTMLALGDKLVELTSNAKVVRVTNKAGTDISGEMRDRRANQSGGLAREKGKAYMLGGQVLWNPVEETINGNIVVDAMVHPPEDLGILRNPITLQVEKGVIKEISGGREAQIYDSWIRGFEDPNMLRIAHFAYGFNPGAKLSEYIAEAERAYGVQVFGIGTQGAALIGGKGWHAANHTDAILASPSVWADDELIEEDGRFNHPELVELERKLLGSSFSVARAADTER